MGPFPRGAGGSGTARSRTSSRSRSYTAWAASCACAVLVLMLIVHSSAQELRLSEGSAGSLEKASTGAPGSTRTTTSATTSISSASSVSKGVEDGGSAPKPPRDLKAVGKDGRVVLTWSPPEDAEGIDTYVVSAIDPLFRGQGPVAATSTPASSSSATLGGLANGRSYHFTVQALRAGGGGGGSSGKASLPAQVMASPSGRCSRTEAPGAPTNLRASPGDSRVLVCWDGVANDACVSEYRLSAVPVTGTPFRSAAGYDPSAVSRGGCANITQLRNDEQYRISVVPYSVQQGEGTPASLTVLVGASPSTLARAGWKCRAIKGCPPGRANCAAVAGSGSSSSAAGCDSLRSDTMCRLLPSLMDIDAPSKQVTQWCAERCTCDLPASLTSPAATGRMESASSLGRDLLLSSIDRLRGAAGSLGAGGGAISGSSSIGSGSIGSGSGSGPGGISGLGSSSVGSMLGSGAWSAGASGLGGGSLGQSLSSLTGLGPAATGSGSGSTGGGGGGSLGEAAWAGGAGVISDLTQRTRESATNMAESMMYNIVESGVVGEAIGKIAAGAVTAGVNNFMQQSFGGAGGN